MVPQHEGLVAIDPELLPVVPGTKNFSFSIVGKSPGHLEVVGQIDQAVQIEYVPTLNFKFSKGNQFVPVTATCSYGSQWPIRKH
jgi:hypothetical protein